MGISCIFIFKKIPIHVYFRFADVAPDGTIPHLLRGVDKINIRVPTQAASEWSKRSRAFEVRWIDEVDLINVSSYYCTVSK